MEAIALLAPYCSNVRASIRWVSVMSSRMNAAAHHGADLALVRRDAVGLLRPRYRQGEVLPYLGSPALLPLLGLGGDVLVEVAAEVAVQGVARLALRYAALGAHAEPA